MVILLVIIWFLSGLLALHIVLAAKLEEPFTPPDVWFALAGCLALLAVGVVCVNIAIKKGKES